MTTKDEALRVAREVIEGFIEEKVGYMRLNNLGDPEKTHMVKWGRSALRTIALAVEGPTCKCGQPWILNTVHRTNSPCWRAPDPVDGLAAPAVQSVALGDPSAKQDRAEGGSGQEWLPMPKCEYRNVPPGKWKVDMPDGTYCQMPGDPPGPGDVRAVINGYVYFVTPRSGKLVAQNPPRSLASLPATSNDQQEKQHG